MPFVVFSKPDDHVALTVGCYSGVRCHNDFDTLAGRVEEVGGVPWSKKKPVSWELGAGACCADCADTSRACNMCLVVAWC